MRLFPLDSIPVRILCLLFWTILLPKVLEKEASLGCRVFFFPPAIVEGPCKSSSSEESPIAFIAITPLGMRTFLSWAVVNG